MGFDFTFLTTWLVPIILGLGLIAIFLAAKSALEFTKNYPPQFSQYTGEWLNFQTVAISKTIAIKRAVSIGLDNNSLHLKCSYWPLKLEATIPWTAIKSIKERRFLWQKYYTFVLADGAEISVYHIKKLEERLKMIAEAVKILNYSNAQELG